MKKLNICILFGGTSDEASVSFTSAKYISKNLNPEKYNAIPVFLDRDMKFYSVQADFRSIDSISGLNKDVSVGFIPRKMISLDDKSISSEIHAVFSVVHGETGEDGVLQGYFAVQGIPYCGSSLASSSLTINKYLTKVFLEKEGIPLCKSVWLKKGLQTSVLEKVKNDIGFPLIIKPTSLGSSVGVFKVNSSEEFLEKLNEAFSISEEVMVEEFVKNRELECAVIEIDGEIKVSEVGEIGKSFDVYSFDEKYLHGNAELIIPSTANEQIKTTIQTLSEKIFRLLGCSGYARIDFFLDENDQILFNEVNSLPGFTEISMFPKLVEKMGYSPEEIVESIINNALRKV